MRTRFDQFAKQMTRAALGRGGTVQTDQEVSPDAGHIDVWFTPARGGAVEALSVLGMLGRIGYSACTLEPFHRTPDSLEVMDCVCKHHYFRKLLARGDASVALPLQWLVSAGRPVAALLGLQFEPCTEWGPGVYDTSELLRTRLVVVAELPETRDTLLLRLMGAGKVLARAVRELKLLDEGALERALALPILLRLRLDIPAEPMKRTQDDEEFAMSTQDIVETFIQQHRDEGLRAGRDEGLRAGRDEGFGEALLELYTDRFGAPPADVTAKVAQTHDRAALRAWLRVAACGSAEEVLAAIRSHAAS